MNTETAKEILSTYFREAPEQPDGQTREALALLASDPELVEWMEQQERIDPVLRGALSEVPVPTGLEQSLLEIVGAKPRSRFANMTAGRQRLYWWTSLAAVVAICIGTALTTRIHEPIIQGIQKEISGMTPDSFDHFRDAMAYYVRQVYFQLDHNTDDLGSIESWLNNKQAPVFEQIPQELLALVPIGCKELSWQGRAVSLVCFHTDKGKIVHLFILDRNGLERPRFEGIERVARSNSLETGGWTTSSKVYVLVGSDPDVDVEFALV